MKNQLKSGVILSYISLAAQMLVQLIYTPIMINLLGQSEYGLYTLTGSLAGYLSLLSFGATGAYVRFYMRFNSKGEDEKISSLNGMFMTIFMIMSAVALAAGIILTCFTPQVLGSKLSPDEHETAQKLLLILVFNIALTFPSSLFDSIVSAHEQFIFQRGLNLLSVVFNPLICLPLLIKGYGSAALVTVTLIISAAKLAVNAWYCLKKLKIRFRFKDFDFTLLREIAVFSFFIFINLLIDQVNWSVDKLILGRISGTEEVSVYGVSATVNTLFICFSTAISSVFSPQVNRIVSEKRTDMSSALTSLFTSVGRIQLMVLGLAASGLVIFGKYFITDIYVTEEYENAYYAALFLVLPLIVPLIQNTGIEIQRAMNKHHFRSYIYLFMAVVNVFISIPLGKAYGCIGTAMGTGISIVTANIFIMNIYYHKAIGIDIISFWKSILGICKGFIIPFAVGAVIMNMIEFSGIMDFIFWIMIYSLVYAVSVLLFSMNKEERKALSELLHIHK